MLLDRLGSLGLLEEVEARPLRGDEVPSSSGSTVTGTIVELLLPRL
jgi:hypothetical protein